MIKGVKLGLVIFIVAAVFQACDKDKDYPETPFLEFKEYTPLPGDSLRMTSYFRDGNGDVGSAVYNNDDQIECPGDPDVELSFEQLVNSEWEDVPVFADYCVLSLTPQGQDKTLEGDIQANFPHPIVSQLSSDTVRYGMTLRDRSSNESNTVWGTALILD